MNAHKPIRKFLPLTYAPKIAGVLEGKITQTIRVNTILEVGDQIAFHGWEGTPYKSPWSFRTPYMDIIWAEPIRIHADFIYYPWEKIRIPAGGPELKYLAALDGIEPATGEELLRILHEYHGSGTVKGKIIRWNPAPIIKQREMLGGNLEILKPGQGFQGPPGIVCPPGIQDPQPLSYRDPPPPPPGAPGGDQYYNNCNPIMTIEEGEERGFLQIGDIKIKNSRQSLL
jgi:hypothetical protein